jgi:dihydroflavonol-4-reductase
MIVAVTGATGHIGVNLVRALLEQNKRVRVLIHHNRNPLEGLSIEAVHGDVCDPYSLYRAFAGVDVVYHLAAVISQTPSNQSEIETVNVIGTRNVVEACLKCEVSRLVHFSTIHAMVQEPFNIPLNELQPLVDSHDCQPYDGTKAAGELEVRQGIEQGLDAVILCPTAVIGPYDYQPSHLGGFLLALAQGKLPALVEGGFDLVDVRDIAKGALQAEVKAPLGAKYLLSGRWASVSELAGLTAEILKVPVPRLVLPAWITRSSAPLVSAVNRFMSDRIPVSGALQEINNSNLQISHARASYELDYHPRPLKDTLQDTFHWFKVNGLLS